MTVRRPPPPRDIRRRRNTPDLNRDRYISTLQVARLLDVSALSVQRWFDAGHLAGARLPGGKRMIETAVLKRFLDKQGIKLPPAAGRSQPVILVVDDEPKFLGQMRTFLELSGRWSVLTAANGLTAGAMLAKHAPDCVVVDVMLERPGGAELVRSIRATEAGARTRIVAISGRAGPEDVERIVRAGADAYLVKPFKMRALEDAINAGFTVVTRRT